ncbi:unnamed protein product, partial [Oppiella nova]
EWGLKGGQIFMLQSRPVTNLDNSYTDYEIMHELDSSHPSEFEIYSRAHWGENFPGATSWTALQIHWGNKSSFVRRSLAMRLTTVEDYNPFVENMGLEYNQVMFNISNGAMTGFFEGYPKSKPAVSMVLAWFGHHIEDKDVIKDRNEKSWVCLIGLIHEKYYIED